MLCDKRLPSVSILMAVYNGEKYLRRCLDSVVSQDFTDFEFIIVDDASSDDTHSILSSYHDERIVYLKNEENIGQTRSLNKGLNHARAPLIARIDADDLWHPEKLGRQVRFLETHEDVAVLGTFANTINLSGDLTARRTYPLSDNDIKATLLRKAPVCHVSVVMRKQVVVSIGGYPEQYRTVADFALWSALIRAGFRITNLPEYLTTYMEDMGTFGARNFVDRESWEGAEIVQLNASSFANMALGLEECRNILVTLFPMANLTSSMICDVYINSVKLHNACKGETNFFSHFQIWKVLVASLFYKWRFDCVKPASLLGDIRMLAIKYRRVDIVLALIASAILLNLSIPFLKSRRLN